MAIYQILGQKDTAVYKYFNGSAIPRPTNKGRVREAVQARTVAAPKLFINPMFLSEGELELKLLTQRIEINAAFYGDNEGIYNAARNMVYNSVKKDLHRETLNFRSVPNALKGIANAIVKAKGKTANYQRRTGIRGFDPFSDDPLVDINLICEAAQLNLQTQQSRFSQFANSNPIGTPNPFASSLQQAQTKLSDCLLGGNFFENLNDNLEGSAHLMSYNFVTANEASNQGSSAVVVKRLNQRSSIQTLASFSDFISVTNMNTWIENGIMRRNTSQGEQPFSGRETAYAMRVHNYSLGNRIGLTGIEVSLILGLATLIAGMVNNAVNSANEMKTKLSLAEKTSIEGSKFNTDSHNPDPKNDFPPFIPDGNNTNGGGSGNDGSVTPINGESNNTGLIIGGLAALAFAATR